MKHSGILIRILLFISTTLIQAQDTAPYKGLFSLTESTQKDFDVAMQKQEVFLFRDTASHPRRHDTIQLRIESSPKIPLIKSDIITESDDMVDYEYLGQMKSIHSYLLLGHFYEWETYYMIDKISGYETELLNSIPVPSPNAHWLAALNIHLDAFYDDPAYVEIFDISQENPEMILEIIPGVWLPAAVVWKNENTLLIQAEKKMDRFPDASGEIPTPVYGYYSLVLQ